MNPVSSTGPQYLPAPLEATGCHIQCSALPISAFLKNVPHAGSTKPKTALEAMEGLTHTTPAKSRPQTPSTIRQCHPADAFLLGKMKGETEPPPCTIVPQVVNQSYSPLLISIGAHSDAVLDHFAIGEKFFYGSTSYSRLCIVAVEKQYLCLQNGTLLGIKHRPLQLPWSKTFWVHKTTPWPLSRFVILSQFISLFTDQISRKKLQF